MSSFRVVLLETPCKLSYKGGYMCVRSDDNLTKIHLSDIRSIILKTQQVYISAYLLSELAKAKISFVVPDEKHNPVGQFLSLYGAHNSFKRISEQVAWGEPIKKRVWQRIVKDKIANQAALLKARGKEEKASVLKQHVLEVRSGDITNREANAARIYFAGLFGSSFSREDSTPINAALNYGYKIILTEVNNEIISHGFLTQFGIKHHSELNNFNLTCDFMEPFRPIVDRLVYDNIEDEFGKIEKRLLVDIPNITISYSGGQYRVGSVISRYVKSCLDALCKRLSVDEIEPFGVL